jgi:carbamoylphosphate synthase small subunit
MRKKVYIVGRDFGVNNMFIKRGWEVVNYIDEKIDLIQFTGGEDVDPSYYGEPRHPRTFSNPRRDAEEAAVYHEWVAKVPMAGICRGGQFLNVMNGGSMWQHVNNHAIASTHTAYDYRGKEVQVTSTHHQMMIPGSEVKCLLWAGEATKVEDAYSHWESDPKEQNDLECVLYPLADCLCFQPHPEYVPTHHECQDLYFDYLQLILKE